MKKQGLIRGLAAAVLHLAAAAAVAATPHFVIASGGESAPVVVDTADWAGVRRAAADLAADIGKVTGVASTLTGSRTRASGNIIAGTVGKSNAIDALIHKKKIDTREIEGQWESYLIDVVDGDLIIAGSDKRGTIYGIYEISRQIGVSPWHYMADVPAVHRDTLLYTAGRAVQPSPKVKYRGIFINDEWPSFGGWCVNRFGGVNSEAYSHIFELLLRLKANYLWPAMWDTAFNEDDPECPRLADEYGIVMGTSHHEPMMRAHKEYVRRKDSIGPWDYSVNKERVDSFFRFGMERNKDYENIVTIGMRGDGDVAMGKGDDADNMSTLHEVVKGQRRIISDIYGAEDAVPQLWAVFTEVQRYYDAGFDVPDDVTLLLCDNNWGYIRRTAPEKEKNRKGGVGLYYHIDMNGGPWNDRWVNTSPLPKLREQLNLAYQSGIDRIWIINVGDLKPKELPVSFIMDYAWDPEAIAPGDEAAYLRRWAEAAFGADTADEVADILARYPKYNLWRKPEVQVPGLFSVDNYREIERVDSLWLDLERRVEDVSGRIPAAARDAFFQLVYYPAMASSGVARIYNAATKNGCYAARNDLRANECADIAKELFERDSLLTVAYNKQISGGKWDGMMRDKHIGYTQWFMPDRNILPRMRYVSPDDAAEPRTPAATHSDEYSIAATHFTRNVPGASAAWQVLPDLGRGEGCMGIFPVTAPPASPGSGPALEYDLGKLSGDSVRVALGILPTQDVNPARGLRLCVQLNDGIMQELDARRGFVDVFQEYTPDNISRSGKLRPLPPPLKIALNGFGGHMRSEIFDNMRWLEAKFPVGGGASNILKIFMVDPEIVVERIVINPDDSTPSYFGPPEKLSVQ